ncbi:MAG: leucine--tRNA ligase [Chloroflexi bacterium]|nr:leucine--tRNA ligase [Chloroflexota bacterium]|tara:strand:- start:446 stop:2908 length:2463 start_codon:yes stop_codon:yes gene_type:complete
MTPKTIETRFPHANIESKWQKKWQESNLYKVDDNDPRPKWYELTMYPYPSGDLHVGHWYAMTGADIHARFKTMQGYNVLHPMGFDAFGLNAENAAIERGIHPHSWTMDNIKRMRDQLASMGPMYDWDREVVTCVPEYYKWNQWFFLQFYKKGLAYRDYAPVNWCPSCATVLANEQVIDGTCERCDTTVTHRDMNQWFFRITEYAEELLDQSKMDWPERINTMQTNWIGKSDGVEFKFDISEHNLDTDELITFTTRIDTVYGVTFVVLAPEHPLVSLLTTPDQKAAVGDYINNARKASEVERLAIDREKTGVFLGSYCVNPLTGDRIPILIGDYVLNTYGTGIVMGVPAHDERDFIFAKKYDLPIKVVVAPKDWNGEELDAAYIDVGTQVNSSQFDGFSSTEGKKLIADHIETNKLGTKTINYRMRDWLISRQRYWGTPIPMVYCDDCGIVPVKEEDLPVLLPEDAEFLPTGESPLAVHDKFVNTTCPDCAKPSKRETDTMDTFVDSSWYFLRYASPKYSESAFEEKSAELWNPVDQYTGGVEHAVMHLLYSRFFVKATRDLGLIKYDEPFKRLFNQGTIIYKGAKMSKSRGNVIAPDDYVDIVGADTVRTYLMFIGPWEQGGEWNDSGINGAARWLNKVWDISNLDLNTFALASNPDTERDLNRLLHKTIMRVGEDIEKFKYNTAISTLMQFTNALSEDKIFEKIDIDQWLHLTRSLYVMMAPITPHLSEELWEKSGMKSSVHTQKWPKYDENMAKDDKITLVVQVNGKVRAKISASANLTESDANEIAMEDSGVQKHTEGLEIRKIIYVPGKLLNIVAN